MPFDEPLVSREQVLDGLPAKRASMLLFAIESRTAYLVARSRRAMARFITEKSAEEQDHAFLNALAEGRDLPIQPTIQDLEHHAVHWASLVPADAGLRAALARAIGEKYLFTRAAVPSLRRALGLDDEDVMQAYARSYGQPLSTIYAVQITRLERLRWWWAGVAKFLENLPPFWTAYALTLTETVGSSALALPIALAGVGPIAGVIQLIVLGLVNVVTIAAVTEALARDANVRYKNAYFGGLVTDYLGKVGYLILTPTLVLLIFIALLSYYVGLSTTLSDATGTPAALWAALLFLVVLYFLRRESLDATVASALIVGAINIALILMLCLITLPHIRVENLRYINVPLIGGQPFDPSVLGLLFGVILTSYFGHTSTGNCAKVVLRRDPSGRALIWGSVAAMISAMVLYSIWVVVVNGTISPGVLARTSGTALSPLAAQVGPIVYAFGLIYVILGMGMGSIHFSLGLYNQVREWLPARPAGEAVRSPSSIGEPRRTQGFSSGRRGRSLLAMIPSALIFILIEWLILTGQQSFTKPLGFLGVIAVPILGGMLPILLLVSSRRRGDLVPALVWRWLSHPILVSGIYLLFLLGVLLHGLVIWDDPLQRAAAVVVSLVMVCATMIVARQGAFTPRVSVELRADRRVDGKSGFTVTAKGTATPADVQLKYADTEQHLVGSSGPIEPIAALRSATFLLAGMRAGELKVWTHEITPEGSSNALPARLEVQADGPAQIFQLGQMGSEKILPLDGAECYVKLIFGDSIST